MSAEEAGLFVSGAEEENAGNGKKQKPAKRKHNIDISPFKPAESPPTTDTEDDPPELKKLKTMEIMMRDLQAEVRQETLRKRADKLGKIASSPYQANGRTNQENHRSARSQTAKRRTS
jgi:hypothetical protein